MATLPPELTMPCPPWTHVGLDLAGPLDVKIVGGAKATRTNKGTFKAWIVLILCLNTKAIKLYVTCGYATKDFLLAFDQHVSDCGHPRLVHSDRGSQLISAAKKLETEAQFDFQEISQATSDNTAWRFCPSQGQWRNGATEIFVKKTKRSLLHTYEGKGLNHQELITALKRVANILNSRPVYAVMGPKGGADPCYIQPLTPNMMLIGRSRNNLPAKYYEDTCDAMSRLNYVSELERLWWGQHKVQDFMSLVPTQKWTEEKRNVQAGDIVLIQYSSISKSGEYRLGRIILVEVDEDNLVRTCIVKYSLVQHLYGKNREEYKGVTTKMIRLAIQRLVMIVPLEEQTIKIPISKEEEDEAKEIAKKAAGFTHPSFNEDETPAPKTVNKSIKMLLKAKGEFDEFWSEVEKRHWESLNLIYEIQEDCEEELATRELSTKTKVLRSFSSRDVIERPYIFFE